jgi:hypothetical protein
VIDTPIVGPVRNVAEFKSVGDVLFSPGTVKIAGVTRVLVQQVLCNSGPPETLDVPRPSREQQEEPWTFWGPGDPHLEASLLPPPAEQHEPPQQHFLALEVEDKQNGFTCPLGQRQEK